MKLYYLVFSFVLVLCTGVSTASAQGPQPTQGVVYTHFIGTTSLERLARGESGNGTLLYYVDRTDLERPSLVVVLSKASESSVAEAKVFDAPPDLNYVPIHIQGDTVVLGGTSNPSIIITSLDGWWVRDGLVSYNLDIQVNGPVWTMWGGGYDPKKGPFGWTALVGRGDPATSVNVRDPRHEGLPLWDLRRMNNPQLKGRPFIHGNYAERKCNTAVEIDRGVSPLWPYVAQAGGYEQLIGKLIPPIVVDWPRGRITHFSELVTVRNQNCSYSLYSIGGFDKEGDKVTQANFESPFAFYDLSGQGKGYPNLVLRTERYPVNDPWSTGIDVQVQGGRAVPRDVEWIRYSWRDGIGDWAWDYKVEVLGFHPYTFTTPIAGGMVTVDAPPYEQYPSWVVSRSWPVVTFIDTEGNSYGSSEGIYDWSPRDLGIGYLLGWADDSNSQAFSTISSGFRGEYRFRRDLPLKLYLSPIDNRLHLLGAEGGLWNLGIGVAMQCVNLGDEPYINGWTRKRIRIPGALAKESDATQLFASAEVEEALYALAGYLVYTGPDGAELRRASYPLASFEIAPPTDPKSWQSFQERLAPYATDKPDPKDLKSWLRRFPGEALTVARGQIQDVRALDHGFRFVLDLQPGFRVQGADLLHLSKLRPGKYAVAYSDGAFSVKPLTAPALSTSLAAATFTQLEPGTLQLSLSNKGLQDIPHATLEIWTNPPQGLPTLPITQTIQLLAETPVIATLPWTPPYAGKWVLTPQIRQPDGRLTVLEPITVSVMAAQAEKPQSVLQSSSSPTDLALAILGLVIVAAVTAVTIWKDWNVTQQRQLDDTTENS